MKVLVIFIFVLASSCSYFSKRGPASESATSYQVLFAPHEGKAAFNNIYKIISEAEEYVYLTAYSWSDKNVDQAIQKALANDAKVLIILHPRLAAKRGMPKRVKKLEASGAVVKVSNMQMHEKFIVVDDSIILNSSANLSPGARDDYSENFIFHYIAKGSGEESLLLAFKNEFTVMWNIAKDIITNNEGISAPLTEYRPGLPIGELSSPPVDGDLSFYSSSMNFTYTPMAKGPNKFGQYLRRSKRKISNYKEVLAQWEKRKNDYDYRKKPKNHTWIVRDKLLELIGNAEKNIYLGLNHLYVPDVADALIEAITQKGIDVKIATDNQEYKTSKKSREYIRRFVYKWKELEGNKKKDPPVRFKYYSHSPTPGKWLLNHHKFALFDYGHKDPSKTVLFSGSYNISTTAEHNQYDNMVLYRGEKFKVIFDEFNEEFNNLWSMGRDQNDKPKEKLVAQFYTPIDDVLRIHFKVPVALTWNEVRDVRKKAGKNTTRIHNQGTDLEIKKSIFSELYRNRKCFGYNVRTGRYLCFKKKRDQ